MRTGLSVSKAQEMVLAEIQPLPAETVATRDALGRILAAPVVSTRTLPPADVSAMDGYAVQARELAAATPDRPVVLSVAFEVAAGAASERKLGRGEAARILTGAPLPVGADTVVRQEDTEREADRVRCFVAHPKGENVRPAGEDIRAGDCVLEPGARLGPGVLGLLAALGRTVVAVHQRPRVAILSGGDELVEPDRDVAGGRIVSSNSYALAAQCREAGADRIYLGIARDTPEALAEGIRAGLHCELSVSSAGVSVGDRDYVRPVLEELGCQIRFWGVQMKPGYPMTFGRFPPAGPLVFGLPGNPVSAMVSFEQFVRPALRKLTGHRAWFRPCLRAELTHPLKKPRGRLHFVRVSLERDGDRIRATSTGNQSSGVMRSMVLAQGLLVFPADAEALAEGASVTVQLLDEEFLAGDRSGA
jgi:molybdopterin molybdotransferase